MKILIIGRGGRCHAMAWKLNQSKHKPVIFVAPGNGGTSKTCTNVNILETDVDALLAFAKKEAIDLTIVGPEISLALGIVDVFVGNNLKIFGPTKAAAKIETSKVFAKELMQKYDIPTAKYQVFHDYREALAYTKTQKYPLVIKYNGLAAGKGVVVATNQDMAQSALDDMLNTHQFGHEMVVIEEFLEGQEFSLMAFVDGANVYPMDVARDYKRAFDGNKGPNTGGMGAYSPVSFVTPDIFNYAVDQIMIPTAKALANEKVLFNGVLYGGLILTKQGVKVIEFNARFGDPETEVVLPRLKNDLLDVMLSLLDHKPISLLFDQNHALGVVLSSKGYPGNYEKNHPISIPDDHLVFHMGTKHKDDQLVSDGGRVAIAIGLGQSKTEAKLYTYQLIDQIKNKHYFFRTDIGNTDS